MNAKDSAVRAAFDVFCTGGEQESLKAGVVLNYLLKKPFIDGLNIAEGWPYAVSGDYYEFSGEDTQLCCVRNWWCTCDDYTTSLYTQEPDAEFEPNTGAQSKAPWGGRSAAETVAYCRHLVAAAVLANGRASNSRSQRGGPTSQHEILPTLPQPAHEIPAREIEHSDI